MSYNLDHPLLEGFRTWVRELQEKFLTQLIHSWTHPRLKFKNNVSSDLLIIHFLDQHFTNDIGRTDAPFQPNPKSVFLVIFVPNRQQAETAAQTEQKLLSWLKDFDSHFSQEPSQCSSSTYGRRLGEFMNFFFRL